MKHVNNTKTIEDWLLSEMVFKLFVMSLLSFSKATTSFFKNILIFHKIHHNLIPLKFIKSANKDEFFQHR